ncbi:DNA-binding transcriptional regulator [Paraburkholderia bonniea]|uniref:DNA-binding transcriptional regulator n=1 Tax=Paraburkholderia bonniea TaxID=2152891 RepID=UPI002574397C|nr:DNA-binding transcriptional regulator [Paraburkholderia bonniea]WJF90046.1 DNA-binding transcriptional regulator [Paraburkholderia bonniea]WJF93360.1 DNA-binding transcriptional regulator [Paraburkholderia bonniea]
MTDTVQIQKAKERDPSIRSVERAIIVLRALNQAPVSTLDALYRLTAVPKPTLIRLLHTFEELGLVTHAGRPGQYRLLDGVNMLNSGYHHVPHIVQATAPIVRKLTEQIKWPIAVGVLEVDALVVRYSTIPYSPLSLLHSSINMRLSLVARAMGRAYLAFCTPEERQTLLEILRQSPHSEDRLAQDSEAINALMDATRERGYALRDEAVRPVSRTIAVPVMAQDVVVASIGMTWFSSALSTEVVIERYLGELREASRRISGLL